MCRSSSIRPKPRRWSAASWSPSARPRNVRRPDRLRAPAYRRAGLLRTPRLAASGGPVAVYALGDRVPDIDPSAFVHPDATVIGAVTIGPESSVWPGAVLRGDSGRIVIGARTSVQDGTVIHCTEVHDTVVGDDVTIGHCAHLEGCTIGDNSLIGSGSIVLNGASVGDGALVAAGALVGPNKVVPARARAIGVPARITEDALSGAPDMAVDIYVAKSARYRQELRRLD